MKKFILALASALLAIPAAAQNEAQTQAVPTARLVDTYKPLAGSEKNATSLVEGLRTGNKVTLEGRTSSGGTTTTSFTPPTGKMGNGNVNLSLALAEASLRDQGITNPTPQQLQAALMGGTITLPSGQSAKLAGVLQMRADGMGWGQIAHAMGFKVGEVVSAGKREVRVERAERVSRVERAERPGRPERVEKPDRPEKPERPARPEKPERPGR